MKKLLAVVMLCGLGFGVAHASEPIAVDLPGGVKLVLPLQTVDAQQMLEFKTKKGFSGAMTTLLTRGDFSLSGGAAVGYSDQDNFPFLALQTHLDNKFASIQTVKFGVWVGRDWSQPINVTRWGILASISLW
jgi:hypothetical protein